MARAKIGVSIGFAVVSSLAFASAAVAGETPGGLTAARSDSACAAYVPGYTLHDYVRVCAKLIDELNDLKSACAGLSSKPAYEKTRLDPQMFCTPYNVTHLSSQLAAAYNDHAYFLILCKGKANYEAAIESLEKVLAVTTGVNPNYWLAIRNRGVARLLLGDPYPKNKASADFASLISVMNGLREQAGLNTPPAAGAPPPTPMPPDMIQDLLIGKVLVRPTSEGDIRLMYGLALAGECNVSGASEQLYMAERMTLGPIAADPQVRAASLYSLGLVRKLKAAQQAREARTNTAINAAERARLLRAAAQVEKDGAGRMRAAEALIAGIGKNISTSYYIDEVTLAAKCVKKGVSS